VSPGRREPALTIMVIRKRSLKCATGSSPSSALALAATSAQSMGSGSRLFTLRGESDHDGVGNDFPRAAPPSLGTRLAC